MYLFMIRSDSPKNECSEFRLVFEYFIRTLLSYIQLRVEKRFLKHGRERGGGRIHTAYCPLGPRMHSK